MEKADFDLDSLKINISNLDDRLKRKLTSLMVRLKGYQKKSYIVEFKAYHALESGIVEYLNKISKNPEGCSKDLCKITNVLEDIKEEDNQFIKELVEKVIHSTSCFQKKLELEQDNIIALLAIKNYYEEMSRHFDLQERRYDIDFIRNGMRAMKIEIFINLLRLKTSLLGLKKYLG